MKLHWIRHYPVRETKCYIGQSDVEAIIPSHPARIGAFLPEKALWFSSPLKRAEMTARWLMPATKKLEFLPALKEQHFGAWEGRTYDAVWKESETRHDWSKPECLKPENGESFTDVCARVAGCLNNMLVEYGDIPLVVVAHAGVIRAGLAHALKFSPLQALSMQIDYGSVTHLTYYPDGVNVHYVNLPLSPAIMPR